jgi:hypothetical protein
MSCFSVFLFKKSVLLTKRAEDLVKRIASCLKIYPKIADFPPDFGWQLHTIFHIFGFVRGFVIVGVVAFPGIFRSRVRSVLIMFLFIALKSERSSRFCGVTAGSLLYA